ncbi:PLP-dependent aminotransferase family protein [Treponema sp.]|uniref:MocR-like pyridoxine biosynthesis transcription factor PdxR n=1 Tax=Treponema sp. TaxID=166 RepID=UPI003F0D07AA
MFTCDFSKKGKLTFCEFLIETIKSKIISGSLKANEKLPSKRSLASHLGISVITVQNAYSELISQGYIFSIEKKGFFVIDLPIEPKENSAAPQKKTKPEKKNQTSENFFIDLESNSIGWEKFPFSIWSKIMRNILTSSHESLLTSQPLQGTLELREAISNHLKSFKNIEADPDQIIVGAGTEMLFTFAVRLLGNEKIYAVENPGYKKISHIIEMNGASIVHVPIDSNGLGVGALEKTGASVVHTSPGHHFPTGIVMPIKRRMELLSWANKKSGRYIIEDDYDSEFRLNGKPMQPLLCASKNENVIYVNTFSKTLSPSFRISYMVLPKKLAEKFSEKFSFCACTVNSFEQYALAAFIKEDYYSKHIIRMKNYYRNLRNELISRIENSELKNFVQIHEEEAGLHFLLFINSKSGGKTLKSRLKKNGIKIASLKEFFYENEDFPLSFFYQDKNKIPLDKIFVVNYSGIEKQKIPKTVSLLLESIL